ncbi:hypothetical protein Y88_1744 [Novosphingobium nitrogenifigens DSM 19370]|uniref:Uncharacterized protein n=1 Tax=Novosphingobium nitrogenifigens DSM 19370 TaxID=983920 RepID=F1Z3Q6_9SPHN|nr:hypothetical protein Y88_1744 [Novosphingobium nitrogenifigens DSM 19370]
MKGNEHVNDDEATRLPVGPDALLLTERDRHLDVMTCISVKARACRSPRRSSSTTPSAAPICCR